MPGAAVSRPQQFPQHKIYRTDVQTARRIVRQELAAGRPCKFAGKDKLLLVTPGQLRSRSPGPLALIS